MKSLQFNICKLETSYLQNDKVSDLQTRIELHIPEALQYACCFWSHHITNVSMFAPLLKAIQVVLEEKFLYWLEVLSLLQKVNTAAVHLLELQCWVKVIHTAWSHYKTTDAFLFLEH